MEYREWRNFLKVIEKAKEACKLSKINHLEHFGEVNKMMILLNRLLQTGKLTTNKKITRERVIFLLVEAAGIEPASANPLPSVLHV